MDPNTVLSLIFKGAKIVYDLSKNVKANKHRCQRLSERIEVIINALKSVSVSDLNRTEMKQAIQNLNKTVDLSIDFVQKFTNASFLGPFLSNTSHQEEFESLNAQLSSSTTNLNLALNITQLFDRHQDMADLQADLAEISSKLDEIALAMANQHQELLKHHKEMKNEFKEYFASFKFHLQQYVSQAQNSKEAKKIEEEAKLFLHIPVHDLAKEEKLGQGGYADVYRGMWLSRHHQVAIKVIRINQLTDNVKQSFLNEVATMHKVRYDHILGVFGACMEPNCHALVVEYMSLGSLSDVLRKKDRILSWTDRWSIALQMTKGVNYLHAISIIHRDIKSHNFLMEITTNGYLVKVSDFGLAEIREETSAQTAQVTGQPTSVGTLKWKAPELFTFGRPSKASDIYSLGVVFWELATGCVPYDELDEGIIFQAVSVGNRLAIPDDVPSSFASIITNAWDQEPSKRYICHQIIEEIRMATLSATTETTVIQRCSPSLPQQHESDSVKSTTCTIQSVVSQMADLSIKGPQTECQANEYNKGTRLTETNERERRNLALQCAREAGCEMGLLQRRSGTRDYQKYDLSTYTYAQLREALSTSCDLVLLQAVREEFHRRLKIYHNWKLKNRGERLSSATAIINGKINMKDDDDDDNERAPKDLFDNALLVAGATVSHGPVGKDDQPRSVPGACVKRNKEEDAKVGEQRYFRISFIRPNTQDGNTSDKQNNKGWWYAHFDGKWVARQLEIHPGRKPILLVEGIDDMAMCELSLEETGLITAKGAEISQNDFEQEWLKNGGREYLSAHRGQINSKRFEKLLNNSRFYI